MQINFLFHKKKERAVQARSKFETRDLMLHKIQKNIQVRVSIGHLHYNKSGKKEQAYLPLILSSINYSTLYFHK